jgi:urease accessory protein
MSAAAGTRLLQLASQAFPIGGYSHSQGLESAIECRLVSNETEVRQWIGDVLAFSLGTYELPCLNDMHDAWLAGDIDRVLDANEEFLATRESSELRSASVQMGFSMRALLGAFPTLPEILLKSLQVMPEPSLPCVWSGLSAAWGISQADSMTAYLWSWAENQVLVAMKSVPIGQTAGQRILWHIGEQIEALIAERIGPTRRECETPRSNFAPGLAILSAQHETQYSRLFRS